MHASVVGPLNVVHLRAVLRVIRTVVVVIVFAHEPNGKLPVPHLRCPVAIGLITGILVQTRSHAEEGAVGNGVLVVVTVIECEDLPLQPTSARCCIPPRSLGVEYGLSK